MTSKSWPDNIIGLNAYLGSLIVRNHLQTFDEMDIVELMKAKQLIQEGREFSLQKSLGLVEQYLVDMALKKCGGNRTKAGALLGLSEPYVRRLGLSTSRDR